MKTLILFEHKRLIKKKIVIFLPLVILIIGLSGVLLGKVYYSDANSEVRLLQVASAFLQFNFIFTSFVYINCFTSDFSKGIYAFLNQLGHPMKKVILARFLILYLYTFVFVTIFILSAYFILMCNNLVYLLDMLIYVNLAVFFTLCFSLLMSLVFKKSIQATVTTFCMFIVFNIVNLVGYGIFNPSDVNSISYVALQASLSVPITHDTISLLEFDIMDYKELLLILPAILWSMIAFVTSLILLRKGGKLNDI